MSPLEILVVVVAVVAGSMVQATAGVGITDSGTQTITGASTFTAANAVDIILDDAANVFTGTVQFLASAGTLANVTILDPTPLHLQPAPYSHLTPPTYTEV